jgi:hypothetical protein
MPKSNHAQLSTDLSDDINDYRSAFRKRVFTLLKWGYERFDAAVYKSSEEEDITGDLVKEIKEVLQDRNYPRWVGKYTVHEEPRVNTPDRKGKKRKRLDIEFERVCHGSRPCYPFEAKRLCAKTHATINEYFGSSGMGEFLAGNYAADKDEAGMLGYIQSDTLEIWGEKAKNKFKTDAAKIQMCPGGDWIRVNIINKLNCTYRSVHNRISIGKPIIVYHLFLDFCTN